MSLRNEVVTTKDCIAIVDSFIAMSLRNEVVTTFSDKSAGPLPNCN